LLLNNDAILYPDALATLFKGAMDASERAILSLPQYDASNGELLDIGCLLDPFLNPVPNLNRDRKEVGMVIGACLWIPKTMWNELGGFPEWFGSIGEDLYLCCCARLAGYEIKALPYSGYRHWQGKSFGGNRVTGNRLSTTYLRRALSERNKSCVMALTYPTPVFQCVFPLHLVLLVVEGLALSLFTRKWNYLDKIYLMTLKDLWLRRAHLRRLRRNIQLRRRKSVREFLSVFCFFPHKLRLLLRHGIPEIR
jgi:GT2 family glycosyltransferase